MSGCCFDFFTSFLSNSLIVDGNRYTKQRKIGEGGFAVVHLVLSEADNRLYAAKVCLIHDEEQKKQAMKEIKVLEKIQHKNILRMVGYSVSLHPSIPESEQIIIITEYHERVLQSVIDKKFAQSATMSEVLILRLFKGICDGLAAMHKAGYAHRDIKPDNVLMSTEGEAILIDFGSACKAQVTVNLTGKDRMRFLEQAVELTTPSYRAPELFDVGLVINDDDMAATSSDELQVNLQKADIWALGCMLYAMAFLENPFDDAVKRGGTVQMAVVNGRYPIPEDHGYSKGFMELIAFMLNTDYNQRPLISDVMKRVHSVAEALSE